MKQDDQKEFRFLFITQDDPFYVKLFFEKFLEVYEPLEEIKEVVIARTMNQKRWSELARRMYEFFGPVDFVRMGFRYVGVKISELIPVVLKPKKYQSLMELCKRHGIEVRFDVDIHQTSFLEEIKRAELDLIISVASPVILKEELIGLPRNGCINLHNGRLPKYRGMMPTFWQMYHGERSVGITIHEINRKIDDGRIILQREAKIHPGETLHSLMKRAKTASALYMIEAINMIRSGDVWYKDNPGKDGSYFRFPTKEHVREFKRKGNRIL